MSAPSKKWTQSLAEAILAGSGDPVVRERLDALILWLAGIESPETESITLEFEQRDTSERQARQLTLVVLDPILFRPGNSPWATLGLETGAAPEVAKQRYYRLTKIYHPDRQLSAEQWLNERAEKLNHAYEQIKRGRGQRAAANPGPRTVAAAAYRPTGTTIAVESDVRESAFGDWLRGVLGEARHFQRTLIIGTGILAAVIIALFSMAGDEPYVPRTVRQTPTHQDAPIASVPSVGETVAAVENPAASIDTTASLVDTRATEPETTSNTLSRMPPEPMQQAVQAPESVAADSAPGGLHEDTGKPASPNREASPSSQRTSEPVVAASRPRAVDKPMARFVVRHAPDKPANAATGDRPPATLATVRVSELVEFPTTEARVAARSTTTNANEPMRESEPERMPVKAIASSQPTDRRESGEEPDHYLQEKVRFFLTRYANYYNQGDATGLAALYERSARQQKLDGRENIRDYYQKFFRLTESRELVFDIQKVEPKEHELTITARYNARLDYRGGSTERLSGNANFTVRITGASLVIQDAAY